MDDSRDTDAGPLGSRVQREVRPLAARLREAANANGAEWDNSDSALMREAADCLESLAATADAIETWCDEGMSILDSGRAGAMFALGRWWGDRPWRKRPNQKLTLAEGGALNDR